MNAQVEIQDHDTPAKSAVSVNLADVVSAYEQEVARRHLTVAPCASRKYAVYLVTLITAGIKDNTSTQLKTVPNLIGMPVREWQGDHKSILQEMAQAMHARLEPVLLNYLVSPSGEKRTSNMLDLLLSDTHILRLIRR
jgi:hypothetical protein